MGYAIMRLAKLKTPHDISNRYNHDMRIFDVKNADPLLSQNNRVVYDQLNGRSYEDICEDTVRELQMKGAMETVRKDAVRGIDIYLGFSHEDAKNIDLEEWAQANLKWLQQEFNPADGQIRYTDASGQERTETIDNVKSVVLHLDEYTPHMHAFVVPIDERGHLNAKAYLKDRAEIVRLQSSYAKTMESFGLWRGEPHSIATHEKTTEYYRRINDALGARLPEPKKGETIEAYYDRANDSYQSVQVHYNDLMVQKNRVLAKTVSRERSTLQKERESMQEFKEERNELSRELGEKELTPERLHEIRNTVREDKQFKTALEEYPDRDAAQAARQAYDMMIAWQEEREREAEKKRRPRSKQKRGDEAR